jgi:AcrR family transcriptional regulator
VPDKYTESVTGLRESKKARTAQAIVDAAMELSAGHRFADVSVEEIATAAGIGRRTFFRYFPTKEDVFLDPRRVDRAYAVGGLASGSPDQDEVTLVMGVLAELQRRAFSVFRPEHQLELHRLSHHEPALAARSWLLLEEMRDIVVAGLVHAKADPTSILRTRVLVSACIMAVDVSVTSWIEGGMNEELDVILDRAAEHLRQGFATPMTTSR